MSLGDPERGTVVQITDAYGAKRKVVATSGVVDGSDFPIVWVLVPHRNGGSSLMPWPADSVTWPI